MEDLPFDSPLEGVAWPALPGARGMAAAAILFQLERSQWWSEDRLWHHQARQLRLLVDHARRTVPYYHERLADLDLAAGDDAFRDAWRGLPILDREAVQAAGDGLISTELPKSHGRTAAIYSSGSTGKPVRVIRTELWNTYWRAITVRDHLWHGRNFAGTLAAIRESGPGKAPYPDGDRAPRWGGASGGLFRTGPSFSLNVTTPVAQQAEWLMRLDPDYLLTHPSVAERLARYCLDQGLRPGRLRQVETIAEVLRPRVRELCRAAWGVPVVDMYSTRDAGYIALQCPENETYHVQGETTLVEVVDAAGRPCGPGEVGNVLVTPLHNLAMPLIRYTLGDVAEVGPPCPCGRGLPVLTRILGRRQNMLVLADGTERWPLLSTKDLGALTSLVPLQRYQFVQRRAGAVDLRLALPRAITAAEEAAVADWVRGKFDPALAVTVTAQADLAPAPSGKFEDFVCEIPDRPRP